jgi:uncharacterized protein
MKRNMVGWFEVPVADMDRAIQFYEKVFDIEISRHPMGPLDMGWFPTAEGDAPGAMGSLVHHAEHYKPSANGTLIYFTSHAGNLQTELDRVEQAGGKIMQGKTQISEDYGYMAVFIDSEGNRIALHSMK